MEAGRLSHHRRGSGKPLVLLHGLGASWRAWAPVLMLAEAERDVLALDLPGFGDSAPPPAALRPDVDTLATIVEGELDAAGIERAALAGSSLGGWIALELARRGRASSAVAISPAGMWTERERAWADRFLRAQHLAGRLVARRPKILRNAVVRSLYLGGFSTRPWRGDPEDAVYGARALARSNFLPTHEAMIAERCRGLEEIRCPVLIAWGTLDLLLPVRQARRFASRIPGAELRLLRGLGHLPMADDPELVARMILDFSARAGL